MKYRWQRGYQIEPLLFMAVLGIIMAAVLPLLSKTTINFMLFLLNVLLLPVGIYALMKRKK